MDFLLMKNDSQKSNKKEDREDLEIEFEQILELIIIMNDNSVIRKWMADKDGIDKQY